MIDGVQDVYYNVQDMDRALRFYGEVLGIEVVDRSEYWSSLNLAGARIGLHGNGGQPVPEVPRDPHGAHAGATLTLRVADIDAAVAHLEAAGVEFLGEIARSPWGSTVAFLDPDGNVLKLMQPPDPGQ
jgi:predicted enzyme related to lactoylglutathione lyase